MFRIWADSERNRLYLILYGFISRTESERAVTVTVNEMCKLKEGFDVINDLSEFHIGDASAIPRVEKVMKLFEQRKVRRVVRVVGRSKVGLNQFRDASNRAVKYRPLLARTLAEAEELLEKE